MKTFLTEAINYTAGKIEKVRRKKTETEKPFLTIQKKYILQKGTMSLSQTTIPQPQP